MRGTRGWVLERADWRTDGELFRDFLEQRYLDSAAQPPGRTRKNAPVSVDDVEHLPVTALPAQILVSMRPSDAEFLEGWLSEMRGGRVRIQVPQRGAKAELMETVSDNARHALDLHKTRRMNDIEQRATALEELQLALGLTQAPLRIECFDISHTAGKDRVASMVVFEDGAPRKDAYRTFNIQGTDPDGKNDDTAAMTEVLTRRFRRSESDDVSTRDDDPLISGEVEAGAVRPRRFAYRPDLLVVDGGAPQVNAARDALVAAGVELPVVGLAKRLEEIWLPGERFPVILPRTSAGLYLMQYLRDESHRFAIRKHRAKRTSGQTRSVLDQIPGLGPSRQQALLRKFGSVKRIREASLEQLVETDGIGDKLARVILDALAPKDQSSTDANQAQ